MAGDPLIAVGDASRRDRNDPQRTTGACNNFQWRCDDDGAGRRKLIEVGEACQPKLATAMHDVVVREWRVECRGLAGIGPDRLHADAKYVSFLSEEGGGFLGQSGCVRPILLQVDVVLGILPLRPVGAQKNPCANRDTAIPFFPPLHISWRQQVVWISSHLRTDVDHACGTNKFPRWDTVHGVVWKVFSADPVGRSVEMGSGVLAGLEGIPVPGGTA